MNEKDVKHSEQKQNQAYQQIDGIPQQQNQNASLIQALKQAPNFFQQKYNEKMKQENPAKPVRAGGIYVPPHRLRQLQQQILRKDAGGIDHQRMMWELLRKSINGIINKVNISNIQNIVIQLLNQNILRGKGLLSKSLIKAQMASPNFTHVYAALISVINTKLPQIGNLILKRVMIQFRRAFQRNNKIVCIATTKMIAHLINQKVLGEYAGLQLLFILLNQPTEASVQIACDFMIEAGQVLSEITPAGANAIFQRFKTLLHEAQISQKAEYSIENLFAVRKTGFKQHPGVIPQLDLVEAQDQITHNLDFQQELKAQQGLNVFKFDPFYEKTEEQWDSIKLQILGQQNVISLKQMRNYQQEMLDQQELQQQMEKQNQIQDLTQQDLINLRRTIYLVIQSTVNFQECAHKLLKMNIAKGYEHQLVDMILECCMMERIYQDFFGLLAQRFCTIDDLYKELFIKGFISHYNAIFKLEVNKVRNLARLFAHLMYRFAIDWNVFQVIVLKPETTTAAGRMFLKILFKQMAENLGTQRLIQEFNKEEMRQYYEGLFPIDHPNNLRFAINYFTSIGLGKLTQNMREILQMQQEIIMSRKQKEEEQKILQQLKQEEEMLRLMEEEENQQNQMREIQRKKKEQQKSSMKKKEEEYRRNRMEQERQTRQRQKNRARRQPNKQSRKRNKNRKRGQSSPSSSSSSSSSGSSSNRSSHESQTPVNKKQKITQTKKQITKKRYSSSSSEKQAKYKTKDKYAQKHHQRQRSREKQSQREKKQNTRQKPISKKRYSSSSSPKKSTQQKKSPQKQQMPNIKLQQEKFRQKIQAIKQKQRQMEIKKQKQQRESQKKMKDNNKKQTANKAKSSQSQSSGISSSSQSSDNQSNQSGQQNNNKRKQKQKVKRASSSSSSSNSSSGSSQPVRNKRARK